MFCASVVAGSCKSSKNLSGSIWAAVASSFPKKIGGIHFLLVSLVNVGLPTPLHPLAQACSCLIYTCYPETALP